MSDAIRLSAINANRMTALGLHRDNGSGGARGLYLQITKTDSGRVVRSWIFRFTSPVTGKPRWMGLGPLDAVGLSDARELATAARRQVKLGNDPIAIRQNQRDAARIEAAKAMSFETCAQRYIAAHEAGWRNLKHRYQWQATLAYAGKTIGALPVANVDTSLVLKVLEPIWCQKPETASRLRQRIEAVLDWATARGYRSGENPARWRGHLNKLLPNVSKVRRVEHYAALPYSELPTFMVELRKRKSISALALEFTILTAARTGEVIGARWTEIHFAEKIWVVPADRMKAGREHRVPLSDRAIKVLKDLPREDTNEFIFVGARKAGGLSNMTMLKLLHTIRPTLTVHGFRSTFRDWAAERTSCQNHIVEKALAHEVSDKVEAAYRRGDLLEKRSRLMSDWAAYCSTTRVVAGNVMPLRARAS